MIARLAVASFLVGAVFVGCGPAKPVCGPSTCALGCCDTEGTCVTATSSSACGQSGAACQVCAPGLLCELGNCRGNSGGGNGSGGGFSSGGGTGTGGGFSSGGGSGTGGGGTSTGGGAGTGGGTSTGGGTGGGFNTGGGTGGGSSTGGGGGGGTSTGGGTGGGFSTGGGTGGGSSTGGGTGGGGIGPGDGGCMILTSFPYTTVQGLSDATNVSVNVALEGSTALELQLYDVDGGPSAYTLSGAETFQNCHYCAFILASCTSLPVPASPNLICAGPNYMGETGNIHITNASDSTTTTGFMNATLSTVHFQQWDFATDSPVIGGTCIVVENQSINATW